ncbi:MAG TPA: hypothetical protein PKZ53_12790 [Acidobacteriota bacterium]|nr:hypothetical protein [Acidobacteriota bacterium]
MTFKPTSLRLKVLCFLMTFGIGLACVEIYQTIPSQEVAEPISFESPELAHEIPDWFRYNPNDPYAVFQAWRNLTTREAIISQRDGWWVLAGILKDEAGRPVPFTPIRSGCTTPIPIRGVDNGRCITDQNGYFIIYGTCDLDADMGTIERDDGLILRGGVYFSVCPGYPATNQGQNFADYKKAWMGTTPQLAYRLEDRAFYVVTVAEKIPFDEQEFARFLADSSEYDNKIRALTETHHQSTEVPLRQRPDFSPEKLVTYHFRLISPTGQPVPQAIVEGNFLNPDSPPFDKKQTVMTDDEGKGQFEVLVPDGYQKEIFKALSRNLTIQAGKYGEGLISCQLRADRATTLKLKRPAYIYGKIIDHHGNPEKATVYLKSAKTEFEYSSGFSRQDYGSLRSPSVTSKSDGTFSLGPVFSDKKVFAQTGSYYDGYVESEPFRLLPGSRKEINMTIPLMASVRALVVDEASRPVNPNGNASFSIELEVAPGRTKVLDLSLGNGRLVWVDLVPKPFRVTGDVPGYEPYCSDQMVLEPGEVKLLTIQLTRRK